ncbi:MAG: protease family protein [Patescibacteria group bacterium]|jgi:membrane protease YdiL (CAAX protease family)|nr:protease family protein [Patescibacteria group bacterium]
MNQEKELVLYQIFFIFVLPVALLVFGIVPVEWRMLVLCVSMLFMYGVIQNEKMPDAIMGLANGTFRKSLIPYLIFTLIGAIVFVKLSNILSINPNILWWQHAHFLFLFLPVSLLQEIAYRGFLFPKLRELTKSWWLIILANTILFTILHAIYPMPDLMLPVAFFSGLALSIMYRFFPNLILISLAHSVLNFIAVLHGFFFISN